MKRYALILLLSALLGSAGRARAQSSLADIKDLPSAPQPQNDVARNRPALLFQEGSLFANAQASDAQATATQSAQPQSTNAVPVGTMRLTRAQAEQLALKNNPRVSVGRLLALAQHQVYRESRSAELPTFNGAITAVDANEGSRITAG